eukprot:SM000109S14165  [mRNA]  locus=s109:382526:383496:+ [translate_table: standard]
MSETQTGRSDPNCVNRDRLYVEPSSAKRHVCHPFAFDIHALRIQDAEWLFFPAAIFNACRHPWLSNSKEAQRVVRLVEQLLAHVVGEQSLHLLYAKCLVLPELWFDVPICLHLLHP